MAEGAWDVVLKRYAVEQWTEDDRILLDVAQQLFRFFFTDESGQALLSLLNIHTASCVIDTNVLLQDISRTLKKKQIVPRSNTWPYR